jgi:rhamnulokinase
MSFRQLHAAIDLGASSARLFAGKLEGSQLVVSEVARLPNGPVSLPDGLHWDVLRIHQGMLENLARLSREVGGEPLSVGIDGWGVDYGLVDSDGHLLGPPFHYRDARTTGQLEKAASLLGQGRIYEATGVHEMELNTLFQLLSERDSAAYAAASQLLLVPDLLVYFLTGERRFERTNASTTQVVDVRTGTVVEAMLSSLGLRTDLFAPPVSPGEIVGPLLEAVGASTKIASPVSVVAVASHDTASAVVAVPALVDDFAYVASGTWSLVGLELDHPVIDEESRRANFSNEVGLDDTVRFLRNVMGHWLLQECERTWAGSEHAKSTGQLLAEAAQVPAFGSLLDTTDPVFVPPGDMPARIRLALAKSGEPVPQSDAELVRCIVDSMALVIAEALEEAQRCAGRSVRVVHVVGGGAANDLLLALIAAATGLEVVAGPIEASAIGNILVQLRAAGQISDRAEMRAVVSRSFELKRFVPDPGLRQPAAAARRRLASIAAARATGGSGDARGNG